MVWITGLVIAVGVLAAAVPGLAACTTHRRGVMAATTGAQALLARDHCFDGL
jgi:hypothetical protein